MCRNRACAVVKYSGNLKDDAYPRMEHDADTADLVLVLGTSLGGLNADQVRTGRQSGRQADRETERHTDIQTDRRTNRLAGCF